MLVKTNSESASDSYGFILYVPECSFKAASNCLSLSFLEERSALQKQNKTNPFIFSLATTFVHQTGVNFLVLKAVHHQMSSTDYNI